MNTKELKSKPRNFLIKDLMSPKYRLRVSANKKKYNRQVEKSSYRKELHAS